MTSLTIAKRVMGHSFHTHLMCPLRSYYICTEMKLQSLMCVEDPFTFEQSTVLNSIIPATQCYDPGLVFCRTHIYGSSPASTTLYCMLYVMKTKNSKFVLHCVWSTSYIYIYLNSQALATG